jgi:pre-rRNA-processing protein TSR3
MLLDPHADRPLSMADRPRVSVSGLLGVDCSWNRLGSRGGYPMGIAWLEGLRERRRLPWLLAGNPQHFGRLGELNTAEAFAAALMILGEPDRARAMVDRFPGGPGFLAVNREPFARYAACQSEADVRTAESLIFGPPI